MIPLWKSLIKLPVELSVGATARLAELAVASTPPSRSVHRAPQGSTGPQGSLGNPRTPCFFAFFVIFGVFSEFLVKY